MQQQTGTTGQVSPVQRDMRSRPPIRKSDLGNLAKDPKRLAFRLLRPENKELLAKLNPQKIDKLSKKFGWSPQQTQNVKKAVRVAKAIESRRQQLQPNVKPPGVNPFPPGLFPPGLIPQPNIRPPGLTPLPNIKPPGVIPKLNPFPGLNPKLPELNPPVGFKPPPHGHRNPIHMHGPHGHGHDAHGHGHHAHGRLHPHEWPKHATGLIRSEDGIGHKKHWTGLLRNEEGLGHKKYWTGLLPNTE